MKNERRLKILELIDKYEIDTQGTLIEKLAEAGYMVTQTTVSRDIKDLKLVKGTTGIGTYKYVAPDAKKEKGKPVLNSAITESVLSVEAAQNILVVKSRAGMANAVAVCVDSLTIAHIVGSVAGDDTLLLVIKDADTARRLEDELKNIFGV